MCLENSSRSPRSRFLIYFILHSQHSPSRPPSDVDAVELRLRLQPDPDEGSSPAGRSWPWPPLAHAVLPTAWLWADSLPADPDALPPACALDAGPSSVGGSAVLLDAARRPAWSVQALGPLPFASQRPPALTVCGCASVSQAEYLFVCFYGVGCRPRTATGVASRARVGLGGNRRCRLATADLGFVEFLAFLDLGGRRGYVVGVGIDSTRRTRASGHRGRTARRIAGVDAARESDARRPCRRPPGARAWLAADHTRIISAARLAVGVHTHHRQSGPLSHSARELGLFCAFALFVRAPSFRVRVGRASPGRPGEIGEVGARLLPAPVVRARRLPLARSGVGPAADTGRARRRRV